MTAEERTEAVNLAADQYRERARRMRWATRAEKFEMQREYERHVRNVAEEAAA